MLEPEHVTVRAAPMPAAPKEKKSRCYKLFFTYWPLVVEPFIDIIDALVAAWLLGTEGQGVSDVLFGDYGFMGKLSRMRFRSVD